MLEFIANANNLSEIKFKFDGVGKYQAKSGFSRNFEKTQDVEINRDHDFLSKLTCRDLIRLTKLSALIILLENKKMIQFRSIRL